MSSEKQADSDRFPPTLAAVNEKVSRAHYITLEWKSAHNNSPSLPDPNDYGWLFHEKDQVLEPAMTSLALAPESIIHLIVCNCKTNCSTNWFKCRKNGLNCSVMCGYENCENEEKDEEVFAKVKLETTTNFVNLLRRSVIQLISIISNYSIQKILFNKFLHNFQIKNCLICSLLNSCMTLNQIHSLILIY